jgi:hypothetical protein
MKSAPSSGAGSGQAVRASVPCTVFAENLERAATGEPDAKHRMGAALKSATLRGSHYRKPFDAERAWRRYYAYRAAERALTAVLRYRDRLESPTVQRA